MFKSLKSVVLGVDHPVVVVRWFAFVSKYNAEAVTVRTFHSGTQAVVSGITEAEP